MLALFMLSVFVIFVSIFLPLGIIPIVKFTKIEAMLQYDILPKSILQFIVSFEQKILRSNQKKKIYYEAEFCNILMFISMYQSLFCFYNQMSLPVITTLLCS